MESQHASKGLLYIAKIFILCPCQHRVRMRMREAQLVGFASCFLLSAAGGERDNRENNMHRFGQRRRFLLDSCFFIFSPLYRDHSAVLSPAVPKFGSVRSFFRRARISCIISFFCLFGAGCCWSAGAAPFEPSSPSSSSSPPSKSPSSKSSSSLSLSHSSSATVSSNESRRAAGAGTFDDDAGSRAGCCATVGIVARADLAVTFRSETTGARTAFMRAECPLSASMLRLCWKPAMLATRAVVSFCDSGRPVAAWAVE